MKNILRVLPFVLLISFMILNHLTVPNIASSIIIASLSALCGYVLYLNNKEIPDIRAEVEKAFEKRDAELQQIRQYMGQNDLIKQQAQVKNFRF